MSVCLWKVIFFICLFLPQLPLLSVFLSLSFCLSFLFYLLPFYLNLKSFYISNIRLISVCYCFLVSLSFCFSLFYIFFLSFFLSLVLCKSVLICGYSVVYSHIIQLLMSFCVIWYCRVPSVWPPHSVHRQVHVQHRQQCHHHGGHSQWAVGRGQFWLCGGGH